MSEFDVRLLVNPVGAEKSVHWTRMKRFAGPDFGDVAPLVAGAQHDQQKFYVNAIRDWREDGDGNIEFLVLWRGIESTWEPAARLHEDVPHKVM